MPIGVTKYKGLNISVCVCTGAAGARAVYPGVGNKCLRLVISINSCPLYRL